MRRYFFIFSLFVSASFAGAQTPLKPFDPEPALAQIYEHIRMGENSVALKATETLIAKAPNFRLAHMIRGDLLLMRVKPVLMMGAAEGAPAERLQELRDEALVRLRSYRDKPPAGKLPNYFLQIKQAHTNVLLVDTRRSRLYLYENRAALPKLVGDFYLTQGKNGAQKAAQGDQRTPLGIYTIMASVPQKNLTDFYGPMALPLNYPNEWDRINQRDGRGIWLHGVPGDTFSRPPRASDGCLVLANTDLQQLARFVQQGATPIIIADEVRWISPQDLVAERQTLFKAVELWRADWEVGNFVRYAAHYSRKFKTEQLDLQSWLTGRRTLMQEHPRTKISISKLSALRYPDKEEMALVEFAQSFNSPRLKSNLKKRQYWRRESGVWRIVYEGYIS